MSIVKDWLLLILFIFTVSTQFVISSSSSPLFGCLMFHPTCLQPYVWACPGTYPRSQARKFSIVGHCSTWNASIHLFTISTKLFTISKLFSQFSTVHLLFLKVITVPTSFSLLNYCFSCYYIVLVCCAYNIGMSNEVLFLLNCL